MRTIDEKIVEMRFDNRNFEENVSESISTLDKLKSKLKFSDSEKSFGNLEKAADKVGFTGIIKAVDTVQAKFSALEIAGITAMARLTNAAIDAGEQFVKSLSVDNIAAGWDKFAKKTTSVGTLIAQGYDINDVNKQLERLNWFTDETSYNFTDMVDSIGKFTAAGQNLENSVTAMEGIALWAARSGQNANVASRAMYQLSQAISSGFMRKQDYMSIQNANMDTQEFRQHALDAAVALGTLKKNADDTYHSLMKENAEDFTINQFAEHLTEDLWFTSDVMMEVFRQYGQAAEVLPDYIDAMGLDTASDAIASLRDVQKQAEESGKDFDEVLKEMGLDLNKFALDSFEAGQEARTFEDVILSVQDAVSTGWLNTFEKIFGDYTTQKVFWTDLANELWDVFAGGGAVRNEALTMWSELEKYGREDLFASFWDGFHAITDTIETIKKGFSSILPTTAEGKLRILQVITSNIIENVTKFAEYMDSIQDKLEIRAQRISLILLKVKDTFSYFFEAAKGIGSLFISRFSEEFPEVRINKILDFFTSLTRDIKRFAKTVRDVVNDPSYNFEGIINGFLGAIGIGKEFISAVTKPLIDFAKDFFTNLDYKGFINFLGDVGDAIFNFYQNIKENETFDKAVQGIINTLKRLFGFIDGFITDVTGKSTKELFDDFIDAVKGFVNDLQKVDTSGIDGFVSSMIETFDPLNRVLSAIARVIKTIKAILTKAIEWLSPIFDAIGQLITNALSWLKNELINLDLNKILDFLTGIFMALATGEFLIGSHWVKDIIGILDDFLWGIDKTIRSIRIDLLLSSLTKLSLVLLLLSLAFKSLSTIDGNGVQKATVAMSAIIGLVTGFEKILTGGPASAGRLVKGVGSLIIFALAVNMLANSFAKLAELDDAGTRRATLALAAIIGLITAFEKIMMKGGVTKLIDNVGSIWGFAVAIETIVRAMVKLADLSWEQMGLALVGISAIIALIGIFEKEMLAASGKSKKLIQGTMSLIPFAAAVYLLGLAFKTLAALSWEQLAVGGIAFTVIVAAIIAAAKLIGGVSPTTLKGAFSNMLNMSAITSFMISFAASVLIMSAALKLLSTISWEQLGPALVGLAGILVAILSFEALLSSGKDKAGSLLATSAVLIALGVSVLMFASVIALLAQLDIIKMSAAVLAIGIIIGEVAIAMNEMAKPGILLGAAAMLVAAAAILILAPALATLASVPFLGLIGALVALAGVFAVIGGAAYLLKPVVVVIMELGAGLALVGAGLALIGVGITALATGLLALVGLGQTIITVLQTTLPKIIDTFLSVVVELAPRVANAIVDLLFVVIEVLTKRANEIVREILSFVDEILASVAEYLPTILESAIEIVIVAIQNAFELLKQTLVVIVKGVLELVEDVLAAFGGLDPEKLLTVMAVLAALSLIVAEVAAISAATALATSMLPIIGMNLSWFMENLEPFMEGVKQVDPKFLEGVKFLAEAILALSAAAVIDGLSGIFGQKKTFADFGKELEEFGPHLSKYAKSVSNINAAKVNASSMAVKILADIASNLPKHGGLAQWFTGDSTLATFAEEMVPFGEGIAKYASSIRGLTPTDLNRVTLASSAVSTLVNMAANLPKHEGVWQWFTGDNKLSVFAEEMVTFGDDLVKLSESSSKISDDDVANIQRATNAAKIVAEFSTTLPKHSGVVLGWFTSDNKLSDFANDLTLFGESIKNTASSVENFTDADFTNVERATNAAKIVADFSTTLPKHEGIIASWFTSDNKLSDFANELAVFGPKLMDYAKSIRDLNSNDLAKINGSSAAVKAIADIATSMPQQPGALASWFTDSSMSLSKFGEELTKFAPNLKTYSNEVKELDTEAITNSADAVTAFVNVIVGLPKTDGLKDIWEGKSDLPKFGDAMVAFVPKLKDFNKEISGANIDVQSIYRAATATKYMVDAASGIKPIDGFFDLFTGDASLSKFGEEMVAFAPSLYTFAYNVKDINADKVKSAAYATQAMVNAMNNIKPTGGLLNKILNGEASLSKFGEELSDFGFSFYSYYLDVYNMDFDIVKQSGEAIKNLIEIINNLPEVKWFWEETMSLNDIGKDLSAFGDGFKEFYQKVQGAPEDKVGLAIKALKSFVDITHTLSELDNQVIADFGDALGKLGTSGVTGFVNAFQNAKPLIEKTGESIVQWLLSGVTSKKTGLPNEFSAILSTIAQKVGQNDTRFFNLGKLLVDKLIEGIKSQSTSISTAVTQISTNVKAYLNTNRVYDKWYEAGRYLGGGLVEGINSTSAKVASTTTAMAQSAIAAARIALGIKSPSKVFYEIGSYAGEGLVDGLINYESQVYGAGSELAEYARLGLEQAVMYANDLIQNGSDSQPTIRPVLDLSEIQNGVSQLYGMLGGDVGYDVNGSLALAKQAAIGFGNEKNSTLGLQDAIVQMTKGINGKNGETIYNTFNISGDNAYEIAEEVSRIIQQQVERRDAVWA